LILASSNPGKLKEFQQFFQSHSSPQSRWHLQLKPEDLEIEETGLTFAANAELKARGVALATGHWAIADDSGLSVDALQGAPGVFSARYAANDAARIAKLLAALDALEQDRSAPLHRGAEFCCAIAISDPSGTIVALAEGRCRGEILRSARGQGGFGYDPIFLEPQRGLTFAELSTEEKQQISHRGRALEMLRSQWLALS
jgi:XTP/dITP diphosphohydrolase